MNCLQNYDSHTIFLDDKVVQEILTKPNTIEQIKKLNNYFDLSEIYIKLLLYMYHHHDIDIKILESFHFLIHVNKNPYYFIDELLPYFKLKNKLN